MQLLHATYHNVTSATRTRTQHDRIAASSNALATSQWLNNVRPKPEDTGRSRIWREGLPYLPVARLQDAR